MITRENLLVRHRTEILNLFILSLVKRHYHVQFYVCVNSWHFADYSNADLSYDLNSVWKHNLVSSPIFRCCLQGYCHLHIFILCSYPLNVSPKRPGKGILEVYFPLLWNTYFVCMLILCILIFPTFWLQIKYFHYKIPPDRFETEFKCWQLMQRELLCNNCCKTIFFT